MVQNKIYQTVNPAIISFVIKENYRGLMATCRYAVIICLNFHVFLLFCLILKGKAKALAKLSNKVGFNVPTLLDPTLLDRLAAHVG